MNVIKKFLFQVCFLPIFLVSVGLVFATIRDREAIEGCEIAVDVLNSRSDCAQLFWDVGEGWVVSDKFIRWYSGENRKETIKFQLGDTKQIKRLRFDPSNEEGYLTVSNARVRFGRGFWRDVDMTGWVDGEDLNILNRNSDQLHVKSLGTDPQIILPEGLMPDLFDYLTGTIWFWFLLGAFGAAVYLLCNHYLFKRLNECRLTVYSSSAWTLCGDVFWIFTIFLFVGFPFTENWKLVLGILFFLVWQCSVRSEWNKNRFWLGAFFMISLFGISRIPAHQIHEGHNLFLVTEERDVLKELMPANIHQYMSDQFFALYPPQNRCANGALGCWMPWGVRKDLFAFSSESIWKRTEYSRVTNKVDFESLTELKTGVVNGPSTDFWDHVSDVKRNNLPYYVVWVVPESIVGWVVQWKGNLFWETKEGDVICMSGEEKQERMISSDDIGARIWGLQMDRSEELSVKFVPIAQDLWVEWIKTIFVFLFALGAFLVLRSSFVWVRMVLMLQLILAGLVVVWYLAPDFVLGHEPLWGGDDGLVHSAFGHGVTMDFANGDWSKALRGGEKVYFFIPGMRYLRFFEDILFGDTHHLIILLLVLTPVWMWQFLRVFMKEHHAWQLTLLFIFGLWQAGYVRNAMMGIAGLAEPFALSLFLWTAKYAFDEKYKTIIQPIGIWSFYGILAGLIIFLRPNYFLSISFMIFVWGVVVWKQNSWMKSIALFLGYIMPLILMPLHNLVFGGKFVLFTSSLQINRTISLPTWVEALFDTFSGKHESYAAVKISRHLSAWIHSEPAMMYNWFWPESLQSINWTFPILNAFTVVGASLLVIRKNIDYRIRLIAAMGLIQMATVIALKPDGRYSFFAWDLCYGVVIICIFSSLSMCKFQKLRNN